MGIRVQAHELSFNGWQGIHEQGAQIESEGFESRQSDMEFNEHLNCYMRLVKFCLKYGGEMRFFYMEINIFYDPSGTWTKSRTLLYKRTFIG